MINLNTYIIEKLHLNKDIQRGWNQKTWLKHCEQIIFNYLDDPAKHRDYEGEYEISYSILSIVMNLDSFIIDGLFSTNSKKFSASVCCFQAGFQAPWLPGLLSHLSTNGFPFTISSFVIMLDIKYQLAI